MTRRVFPRIKLSLGLARVSIPVALISFLITVLLSLAFSSSSFFFNSAS